VLYGPSLGDFVKAVVYPIEIGPVPPLSTTIPPSILISNPQNKTTSETTNIQLTFSVTPPQDHSMNISCNLVEVYYSTSWQPSKVYVFSDQPYGFEKSFSQTFALGGLPQGTNTITITAVYFGGYYPYSPPATIATFSISGSSTASFAVDLKPLRIGVQSPYPQNYATSDVALTFTTNEETSRLQYSLDAQDNVTIAGNTTLARLPVGIHNVTVYGMDAFGNPGTSETVAFTVAEPELEPFPTSQLVAASAVASAAAIALGLVAYATKHKKKKTQK
jgi:hypothetical protein